MKQKIEIIATNHIIIDTIEGLYLQSYKSIIAFIPSQKGLPIQLDENNWDYSRTTDKYRDMFLSETKKETELKIASGEYVLTNLNE